MAPGMVKTKTPLVRGTYPEVQLLAIQMRKQMTPAEQCLWEAIKDKQLGGLKFRAQHPVGRFILDFYCASCKLVIELDGAVHETRADYDEERTANLNAYGYHVVRFKNEEILTDLPNVLNHILESARTISDK